MTSGACNVLGGQPPKDWGVLVSRSVVWASLKEWVKVLQGDWFEGYGATRRYHDFIDNQGGDYQKLFLSILCLCWKKLSVLRQGSVPLWQSLDIPLACFHPGTEGEAALSHNYGGISD